MRRKSARSVSIKDIARVAGVSPSTVSRALNSHPRISPETTERIVKMAQEMGYSPSVPARSLVTQDTATIGLTITHVSDTFLARVVQGVEAEAHKNGYAVFLSSSYRDRAGELEVIRSFYERRVSGIIVSGSQIDNGYLELQTRFPLPIVLINCPIYPYSVTSDNGGGARKAVEHLFQLGHRRIAYIGNRKSHLSNLNRMNGYKAVLQEHDIPVDSQLIVDGNGELAGAAEPLRHLMALPQRPTAIFCFNDLTAIGVIHALKEAGIQVPQDCSVVGFDNLEMGAYYCPPLTTVQQPRFELGQHAMRMLLKLCQGRDDIEPEILQTDLVVRKTTAPAPA